MKLSDEQQFYNTAKEIKNKLLVDYLYSKNRVFVLEIGVTNKEPELRQVTDRLLKRENTFCLRVSSRIDLMVVNEIKEDLALSNEIEDSIEEDVNFDVYEYLNQLEDLTRGSIANSQKMELAGNLRSFRRKLFDEEDLLYSGKSFEWVKINCEEFIAELDKWYRI